MKSIPIMCSYVFVSMAYGMMMENVGFAWYYSLLTSLTVYTGAFQFVLITFLSSGASIVTIAVTALLMNSRQSFYSLSFLETFRKMGRKKFYMIHKQQKRDVSRCILQQMLLDVWSSDGWIDRAADPI